MARDYFTLCERWDGIWHIQFGSYDKADCVDERQAYRDAGTKARDLTIIKTPAGQPNIDAALAALNRS